MAKDHVNHPFSSFLRLHKNVNPRNPFNPRIRNRCRNHAMDLVDSDKDRPRITVHLRAEIWHTLRIRLDKNRSRLKRNIEARGWMEAHDSKIY